jgi:hypothetical protein
MLYYLVNYFFKNILRSPSWGLVFGIWSLCLHTPQFIRPTVPRPVNIVDFACFIRPNIRPKASQIRPIRPKLVSNTAPVAFFDQHHAKDVVEKVTISRVIVGLGGAKLFKQERASIRLKRTRQVESLNFVRKVRGHWRHHFTTGQIGEWRSLSS